MFPVSSIVPGFGVLTRDLRVHSEYEEVDCKEGRPEKISSNGTTFVGAARWLRKAMCDDKFNQILAQNKLTWQFTVSHGPRWGGQFQRIVGFRKMPSTRPLCVVCFHGWNWRKWSLMWKQSLITDPSAMWRMIWHNQPSRTTTEKTRIAEDNYKCK